MFRFRLQQVLDLRVERERQLAAQLAQALGAERTAVEHLYGLQAVRAASADEQSGTASRSVGELAHLAFVLEQLDGHIATAHEALAAAAETVSGAQDALTGASQDRRVLDRLRERHAEAHRADAEQQDRRTMDAVALVRYTQGNAEGRNE